MQICIKNKKTYDGEGEYVGRPSALGNPIKIDKNTSRSVSIYRYAIWLHDAISCNDPIIIEALDHLFSILVDNQKLNLICWCTPEACHAEIIKKCLMNRYYHGTYLINDRINVRGGI